MNNYTLYHGDCLARLKELPSNSVQCITSSPPYYGLRDYQVDGQIGLEQSPQVYVAKLVEVFREARRVLKDDGTLWLNLGDSYASVKSRYSSKPQTISGKSHDEPDNGNKPDLYGNPFGIKDKDLLMIPARVAIALQDDGWWLRSEIVWAKPNPMPESVTDRPTKAHEMIYLLTKSARYFYDNEAVREGLKESSIKRNQTGWNGNEQRGYVNGNQNHMSKYLGSDAAKEATTRNLRSVWRTNGNGYALIELPDDTPDEMTTVFNIATRPFTEAHFATFPLEIPMRCIKAGTSERGECPHCGKAWVRVVEREGDTVNGSWKSKTSDIAKNSRHGESSVFKTGKISQSTTIGFTPQCQCTDHEPVPQTVMDVFNGAATTGVAALLLGRKYIGIELNPNYLEISRKRLQNYSIEMPDEIEQPKVIKRQIAMF